MSREETIEAEVSGWHPIHSTGLIAESRGAVSAVRVESGRIIVTANSEDIERVRGLMQARGLNPIERPV